MDHFDIINQVMNWDMVQVDLIATETFNYSVKPKSIIGGSLESP